MDAPCTAAPRDLELLAGEYAELEAKGEEEAASDALALQDAKLAKVKLQALLQRYHDRRPGAEELAERYEAELDELSVEVRRLREENARLAMQGLDACGSRGAEALTGGQASGSSSSRPPRLTSPRSPRPSGVIGGSPPRAKPAAAQVAIAQAFEEAKQLWCCQAEVSARRRRTKVDEWYLERLRAEMQGVAQTLRCKERELADFKRRYDEAEGLRRDLSVEGRRCVEELELERRAVVDLHRETLGLREACFVPAQVKRKSCNIMRFLDQEGGRLSTERHLRGLQAAAKLYQGVSTHAPSLRALAGRAKAGMEEEFARYQRLEKLHARALQTLHLSVTRDVLATRPTAA